MHIEKSSNECCGCSACASICPKNAISMIPDVLGFKYPIVDKEKCVDCGLCVKVCQFKKDYDVFGNQDPIVYAFRNKEESQLKASQSGAAFYTLAQHFLLGGGVVYGVGLDSEFNVVHKRVSSIDELEELRGSKYVQSDVCKTFLEVKEDIKNGLKVLYSGTSCQIAGLKSFMRNKHANLYTIDIVCHGVPSPYIWKNYLESVRKKNKSPLLNLKFRDKIKGWRSSFQSFTFADGRTIYTTDYSRIFYSNLALRNNCFECPYTNFSRVSDITIADFWGIEKTTDRFDDNKGVSLVLINSSKGIQLFDSVRSQAITLHSDKHACLQHHLQFPTERPDLRSQFEKDYSNYGYDYVVNKYFKISIVYKLLINIKQAIKILITKK